MRLSGVVHFAELEARVEEQQSEGADGGTSPANYNLYAMKMMHKPVLQE